MATVVGFCSAPDLPTARRLAGVLLDNRLAACVSILPGVESHYNWKGKRECSQEFLLKIKAPAWQWRSLVETLAAEHPYECPEIIRFDAADILPEYEAWVHASCRSDD